MPHRLVVGSTMTGKTTVARTLAAEAVRRGVAVTVYDPLNSDWHTDNVYTCEEEFFSAASSLANSGAKQLAIIDEADTVLNAGNRQRLWIATRGRHYGIELVLITQRPTLIVPTARNMCGELYAFRVSSSDAALLAQDFADDRIKDRAPALSQGQFLRSYWKNGKKELDIFRAF